MNVGPTAKENADYARLVSATLPNHQDVATFLQVELSKNLFYRIDHAVCGSYFIDITENGHQRGLLWNGREFPTGLCSQFVLIDPFNSFRSHYQLQRTV